MQTQTNAPVRTKVTVAVAIFIVVNLLLSTVVQAAVAMHGQSKGGATQFTILEEEKN